MFNFQTIINFIIKSTLITLLIINNAQAANSTVILERGLPSNTQVTQVGTEVYLNGLPTLMIGIAVPMSIKDTAKFLGNQWAEEGWKVTLEKRVDLIMVIAVDENYQKVATLNKTGENKTEGAISLTDLPRRMRTGKGENAPVAEHLVKPINSMVLNEVRIKDAVGDSIMTTLTNSFNVEQNSAFYEERMVELGWKRKKKRTIQEGASIILVFEKKNQESTFTFVRTKQQTFVTVNWVTH